MRRPMADRHQLRSGLGCRLLDDGAAEVSLELVVAVDDDGVVFDMLDELLLSLGMVVLEVDELGVVALGMVELGIVVDGLVAGVEVVVLESAGRVVPLYVDCA
jgi:hypothetical protein